MRLVTTRRVAAMAALAACLVVPASAPAQAPSIPDITDQEFLATAAQSNRFEIVTGALAVQRARSRSVRRLGRQFARHHSVQLELGTVVAEKLGVPLPAGLNTQQRSDVARLRDRHGRRFDRLWLRIQIKAHTEAIALHLRAGVNGDTPDVRTLAVSALPVIGQHYGELLIVSRRQHQH